MSVPGADASFAALRTMVLAACRELTRRGLTHGTSGNVSVRYGEQRFFVSPSGMDYETLQAEDVPPRATALACTGRGIPAFHYMVAIAGGRDIRCAPYHTFGTQELSDAALTALQDRKACLLANHGVIATGADLTSALSLAGEVENLALQYSVALALGEVHILDDAAMCRVVEKFRTYGQRNAADPDLIFGGAEPGTVKGK